ncbi:MAG: DUF5685 family protein [Hespellia sp.]|nr:DUF5685 family protein [Hespellia sp.]
MFGYIIINKAEMKFKDFDLYHSYYCGLCSVLKKKYGKRGQMTLSYDMTFLLMLLTGLYEPESQQGKARCIAHPFEKHATSVNEYTEYVADMNILLSYYKCKDDWQDEKKFSKMIFAKMLESKNEKVRKKYEKKAEIIAKNLNLIFESEQQNETNIDKMAGYFGEIMGQIFMYQDDIWKDSLYKIGFYLGKFIYLMDAYEDIEEDIKKNNYNPFITTWRLPDFDEKCRGILTMMMAECSKEFEKLPIIEYTDILRNILYSGVWCRYELVRAKRSEKDKDRRKNGSI